METVLGIKGRDFVMLAADTMVANNIYFLKDDQSKIRRLSKLNMMGVVGRAGDTLQFVDFIKNNVKLYEIRNGYPMAPTTMVHFTRNHLVENLRNNVTCHISMLLASYDLITGPHLSSIDAQGAKQTLNYHGHGMGNVICSSIFHMLWKPDLSHDQAYNIIRKCVTEIKKRLVINLRNFEVYVVDKEGVRQLDSLNSKT